MTPSYRHVQRDRKALRPWRQSPAYIAILLAAWMLVACGEDSEAVAIPPPDGLAPTVTAANITVIGASGNSGSCGSATFIVGDVVIVIWDNSALGDNNPGIVSVTADISDWGGPSATAMMDEFFCGGVSDDGVYEACYTLLVDTIETPNANASVTASNADASTTTAANAMRCVDTAPPTLLSAVGSVGQKQLAVTFGESVYSANDCKTSTLNAADFVYTDGNSAGATAISSVVDGDGSDGVISFTMNANFVSGDSVSDSVAAQADSVFDCAGNVAGTEPVIIAP